MAPTLADSPGLLTLIRPSPAPSRRRADMVIAGRADRATELYSKTKNITMLPPQQGEIKNSLLIAQFSSLRNSISEVIISELMPLRAILECSAKDINVRLYNLEEKLQTREFLAEQAACTEDKKSNLRITTDQDSRNFAGIGIILISNLMSYLQGKVQLFLREPLGREQPPLFSKSKSWIG